MKAMLAQLSPNEETSLRRIGAQGAAVLDPKHGRRLLHLQLIEWRDSSWRLTAVGRKRYDTLFAPAERFPTRRA